MFKIPRSAAASHNTTLPWTQQTPHTSTLDNDFMGISSSLK
jgi:hypothetical protein